LVSRRKLRVEEGIMLGTFYWFFRRKARIVALTIATYAALC